MTTEATGNPEPSYTDIIDTGLKVLASIAENSGIEENRLDAAKALLDYDARVQYS